MGQLLLSELCQSGSIGTAENPWKVRKTPFSPPLTPNGYISKTKWPQIVISGPNQHNFISYLLTFLQFYSCIKPWLWPACTRKKEQMTWGVSTEQLATVCAKQNIAHCSVRAHCCKTLPAQEVADPCARRACLRTETTNLSSRVHIIPSRTHKSAIFLHYGQNCPLKSVKCTSWPCSAARKPMLSESWWFPDSHSSMLV